VLRAAGETETTEENIQVGLELDEGNLRFHLLTEEEISAVIVFYFVSSAPHILFNCPFICFPRFLFCLLGLSFSFINPD
jgi:hypothetical protein